jgi:hypothetical protein
MVPSGCYVTADDLHRDLGFRVLEDEGVDIGGVAFGRLTGSLGEEYEVFLKSYGGRLDAYCCEKYSATRTKNPERYHPDQAEPKDAKGERRYLSRGDVQISRSCKALVAFITTVRNARVHFIMDNIGAQSYFTRAEARHVKKYGLDQNVNFLAYTNGSRVNSFVI